MWKYIVVYIFISWGNAPCPNGKVSYRYDAITGDTLKVYKLCSQIIKTKMEKRFDSRAEAMDLYNLASRNLDSIHKPKKNERKIIYLKLDSILTAIDTIKNK